jgi:hypothetical protein
MENPYHLSRQFAAIKNASQEEEANVGVMWLEDWPGLQLLFSITMTQKRQHYRIIDKMDVGLSKNLGSHLRPHIQDIGLLIVHHIRPRISVFWGSRFSTWLILAD